MQNSSKISARWSRCWIVLGVLYGIFFSWYTSFEGPLTDEEIQHFSRVIEESPDGHERLGTWTQFMRNDTGDDFVVLNAIDFSDSPKPLAGHEAGESSRQLMRRYSNSFMSIAVSRATHPVLVGSSAGGAIDLWGLEGADNWDQGALVRYRSRRDLMMIFAEMNENDTDIHKLKVAAIDKTVAFPLDPWFQLGDPRLVLGMLFVVVGLLFQMRLNRIE